MNYDQQANPVEDASRFDEETRALAKCVGDATTPSGTVTGDKPSGEQLSEDGEDLTSPVESFDDMNLSEDLLRGIYSYGLEAPSLIQQRAIRAVAANNRDVIAQAQSGTGKTAAFCTGMLQVID